MSLKPVVVVNINLFIRQGRYCPVNVIVGWLVVLGLTAL